MFKSNILFSEKSIIFPECQEREFGIKHYKKYTMNFNTESNKVGCYKK